MSLKKKTGSRYYLSSECYIIPYQKNTNILYLPLANQASLINDYTAYFLKSIHLRKRESLSQNEIEKCEEFVKLRVLNNTIRKIEKGLKRRNALTKKKFEPISLSIIPTMRCNLKCIYCYASSAVEGLDINESFVKKAIDLVIYNCLKKGQKHVIVFFTGGGEPFLRFDIIKSAIEYVNKKCNKNGLIPKVSLVTNGTFLYKYANWIIEHDLKVSLSFDGPRKIQDANRPTASGRSSYDLVIKGLNALYSKLKKPLSFRVTVTQNNLGKCFETTKFLSRYKPASIAFEPSSRAGRAKHLSCSVNKKMIKEDLLKAYNWAVKKDIHVASSCTSVEFKDRFCSGSTSMVITPYNLVSTCFEVSRKEDDFADYFVLGYYSPKYEKIVINNKKAYKLLAKRSILESLTGCKDCFVKWACAGGCYMRRLRAKKEPLKPQGKSFCSSNKEIFKEMIMRKIQSKAKVIKVGMLK